MTDILQAINDKLNEVTELKYIDENWGQLDLYGPQIPVQWPCALVDFNTGQFTNIGRNYRVTPQNRQEGTLTVEITIANLKLTNSSNKAPTFQKEKAFAIWDLINKVHEILQGWNPAENAGALIRTTFSKVRRDDGVQEFRVIYSIGLHDC
ncbi:hypothetical protein EG344_00660 [Chryseobacterium sp. G0162]|uniref:hypothetical protein n=1 Tax=Chryseobacterium sp. G0162 TaxID=2487063 RepID=UPI000F5018DF|nr:hypothetical protein [Chryseobacterium sp. G0162]AZB07453.1 hypothetical protein EG344_00660 [Chryseobacterium sp. G0162]